MSRVLLTTDCVGGVWRYSVVLARALQRRGWTPALATIGPGPDAHQRQEASGLHLIETAAPLDWAPDAEARLASGRRALQTAAADWKADAVILSQPAFGGADWTLPVLAVAHSSVATWFAGARGTPEPEEWRWHGKAAGAGLRAAAAAVAPSRAFADAVAAAHGPVPRLRVIYNGVEPPAAAPRDGRPVVLAAGRLWDESKDMAALDRAAAGLSWPVEVAGPASAPGGAAVRFERLRPLGALDRAAMQARMAAAGIFVSPSLYEPFGLAVLEAAGFARPLVLSDIPTFRELWDGAARFSPPGDAAALREALRQLIEEPEERARLGAAARARALRFTPEVQAEAYHALLCRLTVRHRGAA